MRAREYALLTECVETGVALGWARAHKRHDNPTPGQIQEAVCNAVMLEIGNWFIFAEDGSVEMGV